MTGRLRFRSSANGWERLDACEGGWWWWWWGGLSFLPRASSSRAKQRSSVSEWGSRGFSRRLCSLCMLFLLCCACLTRLSAWMLVPSPLLDLGVNQLSFSTRFSFCGSGMSCWICRNSHTAHTSALLLGLDFSSRTAISNDLLVEGPRSGSSTRRRTYTEESSSSKLVPAQNKTKGQT